jgi:hypothetical protein
MEGLGKVRRVRVQAQSDDIGKEEESKSKIRSPCERYKGAVTTDQSPSAREPEAK